MPIKDRPLFAGVQKSIKRLCQVKTRERRTLIVTSEQRGGIQPIGKEVQ